MKEYAKRLFGAIVIAGGTTGMLGPTGALAQQTAAPGPGIRPSLGAPGPAATPDATAPKPAPKPAPRPAPASQTTPAGSPESMGTYLTEEGDARIRFAPCATGMCGTIVSLQEPNTPDGRPKTDVNNPDPAKRARPLIGLDIVTGMQPDGEKRYKGTVYNAENGKVYTAYVTFDSPTTVKLEGCVLGGIICGSQTWSKVR